MDERLKIILNVCGWGGLIAIIAFSWLLRRSAATVEQEKSHEKPPGFIMGVILGLAGLGAVRIAFVAWRALRLVRPREEALSPAAVMKMLSEHVPPAPEAWTPEANARLRWLVRGKPRFVGDAVICPLIPCRMQEIIQLTEHESDAVPADLLEAKQLASGPMSEFLDSLESFAIMDSDDRKRIERDLVERLMKANEDIGRPQRAELVDVWWLRRQLND